MIASSRPPLRRCERARVSPESDHPVCGCVRNRIGIGVDHAVKTSAANCFYSVACRVCRAVRFPPLQEDGG